MNWPAVRCSTGGASGPCRPAGFDRRPRRPVQHLVDVPGRVAPLLQLDLLDDLRFELVEPVTVPGDQRPFRIRRITVVGFDRRQNLVDRLVRPVALAGHPFQHLVPHQHTSLAM